MRVIIKTEFMSRFQLPVSCSAITRLAHANDSLKSLRHELSAILIHTIPGPPSLVTDGGNFCFKEEHNRVSNETLAAFILLLETYNHTVKFVCCFNLNPPPSASAAGAFSHRSLQVRHIWRATYKRWHPKCHACGRALGLDARVGVLKHCDDLFFRVPLPCHGPLLWGPSQHSRTSKPMG
jgi:hypothetical protein